MTKRYSICWSDDELTFQAPDDAPSLSVEKRGASGALGQLFSRRFVVFDQQGKELFQVVNGNSGTYPRASLIVDGREEFVLTARGNNFNTTCNVTGGPCNFLGDPFSKSFEVTLDGASICSVDVTRGEGKATYTLAFVDDSLLLQALMAVATLAVFCGRIIPCVGEEN